ncbi:MAG: hypothetical protein RDU20_06700 [Desulfomonilaceae bacterium]|nr:hypothetical protein [Desulfomonilaceae bacterium]
MQLIEKITDRRTEQIIAVAAGMAAILLTPPFWTVYKLGVQAVFNYFKQDTFYYLAIAARSRTGFYTFDGESATSGFHPLWQLCVTGLFNLFPDMDRETHIFSIFFLSVVTVTLGYLLAGLALYKITRSRVLAILLVPGLLYLAFSFVTPFSNSPWSYMNGMESGLTILLAGVLFTLTAVSYGDPQRCMQRRWFIPVLGVVLALMVLARLDDVFLVPAFALCSLFWGERTFRGRLVTTVALVAPVSVILTCYMLFNWYTVGSFMPISGVAKSGFALTTNLRQLGLLSGLQPFPLSMNAYVQFFEIFYRHIQMLFPMILAVLFLSIIRKGGEDFDEIRNRGVFLTALLLYVIFKGLYNLVNVHVNHQGLSWYYPLSEMSVNFTALVLLSPVYRRCVPSNPVIRVTAVGVLTAFLAIHVIMATAVTMNVHTHGNRIFAFWQDAQNLASELRTKNPGVKLVEFDDAFITYSTGIPAIHGIGFALDYEGFKAKREGKFLKYCHEKGFDTIASLQYVPLGNSDLSSSQIAQRFKKSRFFGREDLDRYQFEVLLVDRRTGATFVRFKPKIQGNE